MQTKKKIFLFWFLFLGGPLAWLVVYLNFPTEGWDWWPLVLVLGAVCAYLLSKLVHAIIPGSRPIERLLDMVIGAGMVWAVIYTVQNTGMGKAQVFYGLVIPIAFLAAGLAYSRYLLRLDRRARPLRAVNSPTATAA